MIILPFEVERATLEPKNVDERVLRLAEEHEVCFTFFLLNWILKKKKNVYQLYNLQYLFMFDWQWQREKDKLHNKITDLEKKLNARQALDLEI